MRSQSVTLSVLAYTLCWTLSALLCAAMIAGGPFYCIAFGLYWLVGIVVTWPINVLWALSVTSIGLLHRRCLSGLKRFPTGQKSRFYALLVSSCLGVTQMLIATIVAQHLHWYDTRIVGSQDIFIDLGNQDAYVHISWTQALLQYGVPCLVASVICGFLLAQRGQDTKRTVETA